jgi:hypothetical protein
METSIKFSCTTEELKKALEGAGFRNPEIENDKDVASAITSLIAATSGAIGEDIKPIEKDCKYIDPKVIIAVEKDCCENRHYISAVKRLQTAILGESI